MKWLCSSSLWIIGFCTTADAGEEIKHYRLSKNTKRQQKNRTVSYTKYKQNKTVINWNKDDIDQKGFPDNNEDLRNVTSPYSQILEMEKNRENIIK